LGNSPQVGAAAGEDLALVTGRGQPDLTDIEGRAPYVRDGDVAVLGIRDDDEASAELASLGVLSLPAAHIRSAGPGAAAVEALTRRLTANRGPLVAERWLLPRQRRRVGDAEGPRGGDPRGPSGGAGGGYFFRPMSS